MVKSIIFIVIIAIILVLIIYSFRFKKISTGKSIDVNIIITNIVTVITTKIKLLQPSGDTVANYFTIL